MAAIVVAGMLISAQGAQAEQSAHHRHRHREAVKPHPIDEPVALPPGLQSRAAYQSGFAFGLLDLGISGTPTAISPYAGAGYIGPRYDGPGFGYPGY